MKPTRIRHTKHTTPWVSNIKAAAVRLGLDLSQIRLARNLDATGFHTGGRINCVELADWVAKNRDKIEHKVNGEATPDAGTSTLFPKEVEEALKIRADRRLKELRYETERRNLIPVDEVRRSLTRSIIGARTRVMGGMRTGIQESALKAGMNSEQMRTISEAAEKRVREAMEELNRNEFAALKCPHCEKEIKP
jgi:hypothetical protein